MNTAVLMHIQLQDMGFTDVLGACRSHSGCCIHWLLADGLHLKTMIVSYPAQIRQSYLVHRVSP